MFLALGALTGGDVVKLGTEFKPEPPFVKIDVAALTSEGN